MTSYNKQTSKLTKDVSCATVIISQDKQHILFGKIAMQNKYDLPKGKKEDNESFLDAAMREVYEETGLSLTKEQYRSLKNYQIKKIRYNKDKNITVFFVYDKYNTILNDVSSLCAISRVSVKNYRNFNPDKYTQEEINKTYPELSDFELFSINDLLYNDEYTLSKLNKSMFKVFRNEIFVSRLNKVINKI
jgi:NTP pyrophosphohydrolases including oxidative damage repair enzymes